MAKPETQKGRETGQKEFLILGEVKDRYREILTPEALRFVASLQLEFGQRVETLLDERRYRQNDLNRGIKPTFPAETLAIREGEWRVAPIPADLEKRQVEITGPVDRKMIINALNSGADVFMADFEDSLAPTWENVIEGQINLHDAVRRTIAFTSPEGKEYHLNADPAVLMVRPRGWHLEEHHLFVDGKPPRAALVDFGLYFFHNAQELVDRGTGPYFYLPKLQGREEARLWNDIFKYSQDKLGIPQGTIRATVLVEHILAAFEMEEILWELKEHSAGLNCGRWDYIFSFIKTFREDPSLVLPDRSEVTMTVPFMDAYVRHLVNVCHKRGIHAMGGMAAQIPIKHDPVANEAALAKVRADKEREVRLGHDGTWVAHPGLVPLARAVFEQGLKGQPNQLEKTGPPVAASELLIVPSGLPSEAGLRRNINVGLLYLESWLNGNGCVPLYNLMEDAATAEICRTQIWSWLRHGVNLRDGEPLTAEHFTAIYAEEVRKLLEERGYTQNLMTAVHQFYELTVCPQLKEFLTLPAYQYLIRFCVTC